MTEKHDLTLAEIKPSPDAGKVLFDGLELDPDDTFPVHDEANIVLQAKSAEDYEFVSWDGDISGTDTRKGLSVEDDITFVAEFRGAE